MHRYGHLTIHVHPVGPLQANCYIVTHQKEPAALVIDPGAEADRLLAALEGRHVEAILLTHAHYDHIGALETVREATGAPVCIHREEAAWLTDPLLNGSLSPWAVGGPVRCSPADRLLEHGDTVEFAGVQLRVAHTPGHSPGGVSYIGPGFAFTGDALFRGSIGRTDLPGGNHPQLIAAIREHLLTLPDDTVILPGHGPASTVGDERRTNPFLADYPSPGSFR